jgi:hypothetical protein
MKVKELIDYLVSLNCPEEDVKIINFKEDMKIINVDKESFYNEKRPILYKKKLITIGEMISELSEFDKDSALRIIIDSPNNPPSYPIINFVYPDPDRDYKQVLIDAIHPDDCKIILGGW